MKRSLVAVAAVAGLWSALAPLLLSWPLSLGVTAGSLVPGALTLLLGGLGCTLRPSSGALLHRDLMCSTCSYLVLLGAWLLLGPLLLGYPLTQAGTYLGALLPGATVMGTALANGYLGWQEG